MQLELPDKTDARHLEEVKNCPGQQGLCVLAFHGEGAQAGSLMPLQREGQGHTYQVLPGNWSISPF